MVDPPPNLSSVLPLPPQQLAPPTTSSVGGGSGNGAGAIDGSGTVGGNLARGALGDRPFGLWERCYTHSTTPRSPILSYVATCPTPRRALPKGLFEIDDFRGALPKDLPLAVSNPSPEGFAFDDIRGPETAPFVC